MLYRNVFESKPAADNNHPRSGDSQSVHIISSSSVEKSDLPASPCCRSKVAVFYPVTGFSAVTSKSFIFSSQHNEWKFECELLPVVSVDPHSSRLEPAAGTLS